MTDEAQSFQAATRPAIMRATRAMLMDCTGVPTGPRRKITGAREAPAGGSGSLDADYLDAPLGCHTDPDLTTALLAGWNLQPFVEVARRAPERDKEAIFRDPCVPPCIVLEDSDT